MRRRHRSPEPAGGKAARTGGRPPPLLAVVLYKGQRRWNAPLALAGLVAAEAKPTASGTGASKRSQAAGWRPSCCAGN